MNDVAAKIRISLNDGLFEIEGSEDFVSKQSEIYRDLIRSSLSSPKKFKRSTTGNEKDENDGGDYSSVYHRNGPEVKVLVDPPGSSMKEKTVNSALLALHAMGGDAEIGFDLVRAICEDHSCLNKGNFSSYLKTEKKLLLVSGSGKSLKLRLTQPGKKEAERLVKLLASQNE